MDKETKERLGEIRAALKKYGFDKILGQSAKNKIKPIKPVSKYKKEVENQLYRIYEKSSM